LREIRSTFPCTNPVLTAVENGGAGWIVRGAHLIAYEDRQLKRLTDRLAKLSDKTAQSKRGLGAASTQAATTAMTKNPVASECRSGKPGNAGHAGSQKLDVPRHFFGSHNPREKGQIEDNLPQPSRFRCPEDDPRMRHAGVGQGEKVTVARHQDAALPAGKLQLPRVGSAVEPLLDRHVDRVLASIAVPIKHRLVLLDEAVPPRFLGCFAA
jgi:hypothetical protein